MLTLNHTLQHELVVPLVGTDWSWMMEFLKGMVKPVAATAVVCLAVALSFYQKLGLELEMVVAIVRAFIQLSIIGFVLEFIFRQDNAGWILLAYLFMVCTPLFILNFLTYLCSIITSYISIFFVLDVHVQRLISYDKVQFLNLCCLTSNG